MRVLKFCKNHPYVDSNGRSARLPLNLTPMKAGFPAIALPLERRLAYYTALDQAHEEGNEAPFFDLITECVKEGFAPYSHVLEITP